MKQTRYDTLEEAMASVIARPRPINRDPLLGQLVEQLGIDPKGLAEPVDPLRPETWSPDVAATPALNQLSSILDSYGFSKERRMK